VLLLAEVFDAAINQRELQKVFSDFPKRYGLLPVSKTPS
jgi:hypothetical protein